MCNKSKMVTVPRVSLFCVNKKLIVDTLESGNVNGDGTLVFPPFRNKFDIANIRFQVVNDIVYITRVGEIMSLEIACWSLQIGVIEGRLMDVGIPFHHYTHRNGRGVEVPDTLLIGKSYIEGLDTLFD